MFGYPHCHAGSQSPSYARWVPSRRRLSSSPGVPGSQVTPTSQPGTRLLRLAGIRLIPRIVRRSRRFWGPRGAWF